MASQKRKIFISYRREDEGAYLVPVLSQRLLERYGSDSVFYDVDNIPLGVDFRQHLSSNIEKASVMLVVMGEKWTGLDIQSGARRIDKDEDFVRIEVEEALSTNIVVVPVLVGKTKMPSEAELPVSISKLAFRNAAEVRTGKDFENHMMGLLNGLDPIMGYVIPAVKFAPSKSKKTKSGAEIDPLYDQAVDIMLKLHQYNAAIGPAYLRRYLRIDSRRADVLIGAMMDSGILAWLSSSGGYKVLVPGRDIDAITDINWEWNEALVADLKKFAARVKAENDKKNGDESVRTGNANNGIWAILYSLFKNR